VTLTPLATLQARCPDGPFRWVDSDRLGLRPADLRRLREHRLVRPVLHGVLVRADVPDTLAVRATAAALILPPGAAVCRTTAAWLRGIDALDLDDHRAGTAVVECVVPAGTEPACRPGLRAFSADLAGDVDEVRGVPCTTAARTAIDLARWAPPPVGLAALDAFARGRLIEPAELQVAVGRWRGERFVDRARRLIGLCDPSAESAGESWLRLRFADAGFPRPVLQIPLVDEPGCVRYRLDLGFLQHRASWEYDGEEYHGSRAQLAHDAARREEIEQRWGWRVWGVGKALVRGPSMVLELAAGEVLGIEPALRRRRW
jgi:hypothetical protein